MDDETGMTKDEKFDIVMIFVRLLLAGNGVGVGFWFSSDVGAWGWLIPLFFGSAFGWHCYEMWLRIRMIIGRVRIDEITRHLARLEEIRRAL